MRGSLNGNTDPCSNAQRNAAATAGKGYTMRCRPVFVMEGEIWMNFFDPVKCKSFRSNLRASSGRNPANADKMNQASPACASPRFGRRSSRHEAPTSFLNRNFKHSDACAGDKITVSGRNTFTRSKAAQGFFETHSFRSAKLKNDDNRDRTVAR